MTGDFPFIYTFMLTDHCDIESCFDLELEDYKNLVEIETGPLTELVCKYRDFESVLHYAGNMRYDVETIAGVCGLSQEETRRQLLEKRACQRPKLSRLLAAGRNKEKREMKKPCIR